MAKRPNPSKLRSARNYTVIELAEALGVSVGTVRAMIKRGLPVLNTMRPTLIVGGLAKEFLTLERQRSKRPLEPCELYCLSCKTPRTPFGNMVDLSIREGHTARISGFCGACESLCHRLVSKTQVVRLSEFFEVSGSTA